jgi:hypothetical protein
MINSNDCRNSHCSALRFWGLALAAGLIVCEVVVLLMT